MDKLRSSFDKYANLEPHKLRAAASWHLRQNQNLSIALRANEYETKFVRIRAKMDSKTTQICRSLHGRLIPVEHIMHQANGIINAKSPEEMMSYTDPHSNGVWSKKLPYNIGLPPYHFRCRTEIVPVWVDEQKLEDKTMRYTDFDEKKEVLSHIDKTGVERKLTKYNYYEGNHTKALHKKTPKKDIISALNSISMIAPSSKKDNYVNAISQNGYFMTFNADEIVTVFKPKGIKNYKGLVEYFYKSSRASKKEVIKWQIENFIFG